LLLRSKARKAIYSDKYISNIRHIIHKKIDRMTIAIYFNKIPTANRARQQRTPKDCSKIAKEMAKPREIKANEILFEDKEIEN